MTTGKRYCQLPALPNGHGDLAPSISEQLQSIHHDGYHQKYVSQTNDLMEKLDKARADRSMPSMKGEAQTLGFNVSGHLWHSLYWNNMCPGSSGGGGRPGGSTADALDREFGSFERFQKEFTKLANSGESSGWETVVWCSQTCRPLPVQVKDHRLYAIPGFEMLMAMDVWEHAYCLDYNNEKAKYTSNFWNITNWDEVDRRPEKVLGSRKEGAVQKAAAGGSP